MNKTNFHIQVGEKSGVCEAIVKGDLTVKNGNVAREKLLDLLSKHKVLSIHIANVDSLDLSFLQILLSAKKTANVQNKKIEFHINLSSDHENLLIISGIKELNIKH